MATNSNLVRWVRTWHRRIALVLGLFLLFQGVTGSVTQYRFLLMKETQANYESKMTGPAAMPDQVMATVAEQLPGFQAAHVMYPPAHSPETAVMVMGGYDASKMDMSRMVTVDQYSNQVIADMAMMESTGWVGLVSNLHKWEMFGTTGRIVITLIGIASMIICLFGIWHYWQTRKVSPKSWMVRWHRKAGLVVGVVIFITAATGTALNLFNWYEKSTGDLVTATNMREAMMASEPLPINVGLAEASQIALEASGAERIGAFSPAGPHARQYWFATTTSQLKRVDVLVNPETGGATVKGSGLMTGGGGFRDWLYPLHTGYVLGEFGGLLAAICGTLLLFWGYSGVAIWLRRRRQRKTHFA